LPPLREELRLLEGAAEADGSPGWTIHDPVRQRFFRVSRAGFEFLARWHLGRGPAVLGAIAAETTLVTDDQELAGFIQRLAAWGLLRSDQPEAVRALAAQAEAARLSWPRWLLHHYLFVRLPLVRPDALLQATLPLVRPLARPLVLRLVLVLGLVGVVLALRQWDSFLHTAQDFLTLDGALALALTLTLVKVAHELGHAYTAKAFGCRVPTMGVALLVLWPVLYTDVSDSWRLPGRRQRLLIGAAGVATELALALIATFLWSFLPDGPARSGAFLVATTTWVSTLVINLSPFMRFDGYYLLSDGLGIANLQERSFALARWQLRRWLLALDEPPPEPFAPATRRVVLLYAYATWLYRALVFLGIALLVYHFAFKVLGIFLMLVEIGWFLALPVVNELRQWWQRRHLIRLSPNLMLFLALLAGGLWLLATPWQTRVALPAVLRAVDYTVLFPPEPARLAAIEVTQGQRVAAGQVLFRLEAPELEYRLALVRRRLALVNLHLQRQAANPDDLENLPALQQQMTALLSDQSGLLARRDNLSLRAPFAGLITDLPSEIQPGLWLKPDQPLARLVNPDQAVLRAYLPGADLDRLTPGASGRFLPEDLSRPALPVVVSAIEQVNAAVLDTPALAATQGGPIEVQPAQTAAGQASALIPSSPVYRVALMPLEATPAPGQTVPGTALVEANAASPLRRLWRHTIGVLIRESGF